MQFRAFEPGIEVSGHVVYSTLDGFRNKYLPSKILIEEGLGRDDGQGLALVDREAWYPQSAWLKAFEKIAQSIGNPTLYRVGLRVHENALLPPHVNQIEGAMHVMDVGYHLNHRRGGKPMFDPATGAMVEGIGHYAATRPDPAQKRMVVECANPYPCQFDQGIIVGFARRFEAVSQIRHDDERPCRERGAESCTYTVTW